MQGQCGSEHIQKRLSRAVMPTAGIVANTETTVENEEEQEEAEPLDNVEEALELVSNAVLTAKARKKLPKEDFALSGGRYPISDESHARNALARVSQHGTPEEKAKVRAAVKRKFPNIKQEHEDDEETTHNISTDKYEHVTCNLEPSVRHESLEGRDYLVCPMVMLTEGVHRGTQGPIYYPKGEISKYPASWNHKPIVVDHPTSNGQATTACQPAVMSSRKVGMILNTKYVAARSGQPAKLTAEAWIEMDKLKGVRGAEKLHKSVQNRQVCEVSTGLFMDHEIADGTWNKESYTAIGRNYRPDHLALLTSERGACSVDDGAGLMRNASLSHGEIRDRLNKSLQDRHKTTRDPNGPYEMSPYVQDVYDDFCIYDHKGKLHKQNYKIKDGGEAELSGSPIAVTAKKQYKTADGKVLNTSGVRKMNKSEAIEHIIQNTSGDGDRSEDREHLETLSDGMFNKLAESVGLTCNGADYGSSGKGKAEDDGDKNNERTVSDGRGQIGPKKMGKKTENAQGKKKEEDDDGEEYDDDANKEAEDNVETEAGKKSKKKIKARTDNRAFDSEEAVVNAERDEVANELIMNARNSHIGLILNNKQNVFSEDELRVMGTGMLKKLAGLASKPLVANAPQRQTPALGNYLTVAQGFTPPVANSKPKIPDFPLPSTMPVLNQKNADLAKNNGARK